MPLLKQEADKLSNNQLVAGVIEEIIERDDLFAVLPFVQINSKAYVYNREDTGPNNNITEGAGRPTFLNPNDEIVEGAVPFKEVTTRLRIIAGDVDVDKFLQETESDTSSQMAVQIAKKAKAIGRIYHDSLVNGSQTRNAKEFDGMDVLVGESEDMNLAAGADGKGALTLAALDELVDMVPNGADAIIMRKGTVRAYRSLLRLAGGTAPAELMMENFGRPMLTHAGIPILVNDFIGTAKVDAVDTTSVYAVRLNEADGLHGLYGGSSAGVRLESIGTVQNKDADRVRVKWYAGLALKSTRSLARLTGVTNI